MQRPSKVDLVRRRYRMVSACACAGSPIITALHTCCICSRVPDTTTWSSWPTRASPTHNVSLEYATYITTPQNHEPSIDGTYNIHARRWPPYHSPGDVLRPPTTVQRIRSQSCIEAAQRSIDPYRKRHRMRVYMNEIRCRLDHASRCPYRHRFSTLCSLTLISSKHRVCNPRSRLALMRS